MMATFFPSGFGLENSGMPPRFFAISTMVAWTSGILIGPSNFLRVQAAMQRVSGQTIPQTPPSGLACMIYAAERRMSEAFPTRAAMMKSAGEQ
jgi:hypothetical protein